MAGAEPGVRSKKITKNLKESGVSKSASAADGVRMMVVQSEREGGPLGETSDQPIDITSNRVTAKKTSNGQEFAFDGNVKVKQGSLMMTCDRLTVLYEPKKKNGSGPEEHQQKPSNPKDLKEASVFKHATALGNVKVTQNEIRATAGRAVFDNLRKTITLSDGPKISKAQDWMVAPKIIYYINDGRMETIPDESEKNVVIFKLYPPGNMKQEKEK